MLRFSCMSLVLYIYTLQTFPRALDRGQVNECMYIALCLYNLLVANGHLTWHHTEHGVFIVHKY
jgi:hypothetical protein